MHLALVNIERNMSNYTNYFMYYNMYVLQYVLQ